MSPFGILAVGVLVVLGLILVLRLNAFLALIVAALVVSLLAPGEAGEKVSRVAEELGTTAGKVGIPIAMAAIIGSCLLASGAADRIVRGSLALLGEKHAAGALATSGFVLSVPVFFDTVFFLLVPLARSLFQRTRRNYLKYLLAIGAGGAITHTLVPPTPGPLLVADQLGVDVGLMMLVGVAVGLPSAFVAVTVAGWMDRTIELQQLPPTEAVSATKETPEPRTPGLFVAALPIILPVGLIAGRTIVDQITAGAEAGPLLERASTWLAILGDANLALLMAAAVALLTYIRYRAPQRAEVVDLVEKSLMGAGIIILITAAGGAFGAMLKEAQVGDAIQESFQDADASGMMLWLAFGIASLFKFSQGSSTVAMITTSGMIGAMLEGQTLAYHPVYLGLAIGCGSLFGVWMNDSGFWIFCRMGGLTESEALRTWTPILAIVAVVGMLITAVLATVLPLTDVTPLIE